MPFFSHEPLFADRRDAGRRLADAVARLQLADPLVLALPRGGVPVAFEVAERLRAPLDLLLVRKLGAPGQPELGIGAVVDGLAPQVVLNDEAVADTSASPEYIEAETSAQLAELERRRRAYLGERRPPDVSGRVVVLVDDGVATGGTARVGLRALRRAGAGRLVLAIPVAPRDVLAALREEADDVVCLATPTPFLAVGFHYVGFDQTTDGEVVALLAAARSAVTMPPALAGDGDAEVPPSIDTTLN